MPTAYPFAVDGHLGVGVNAQTSDLGNVADALHICSIATRAEDTRNTRLRIHVVRGDECPSSVACKCDELCGDLLHSL